MKLRNVIFGMSGLLILFGPQISQVQAQNYNYGGNYTDNAGLIYGQQNGSDFQIMERDQNNDPYQLSQINGHVRSYRTNNDQSAIALDLGNSISLYHTQNRYSQNLYNSDGLINNMIFSPDGNQIFFSNQLSPNYYQLTVMPIDGSSPTYYNYNNSNQFYPYAWRSDGIILMVNQADNNNLWYYNPAINQLSATNYNNPYWISPDGMYIGAVPNYQGLPYYRQDGASYYYSQPMSVYDPVTGEYLGTYGTAGDLNRIISYNGNQVLMAQYDQQYQPTNYYTRNFGSSYQTPISNFYQTINNNFNYSNGADIFVRSKKYYITLGNDNVIQSNQPLMLLAELRNQSINNYPSTSNYYSPSTGNYSFSNYMNVPASVSTHQVSISNFSFNPQNMQVRVGETVTWQNKDGTNHTVTSDNGIFDSGSIAPISSFALQFNQPGTYSYHCSIHPNMTGTITVTQ